MDLDGHLDANQDGNLHGHKDGNLHGNLNGNYERNLNGNLNGDLHRTRMEPEYEPEWLVYFKSGWNEMLWTECTFSF